MGQEETQFDFLAISTGARTGRGEWELQTFSHTAAKHGTCLALGEIDGRELGRDVKVVVVSNKNECGEGLHTQSEPPRLGIFDAC